MTVPESTAPADAPAGAPRLARLVVDSLKQDIATGRLAPGERLPSESELTRDHGVSRTVVREAVSRLRAEGLVVTYQGRGSFVTGTHPSQGEVAGGADAVGTLLSGASAREVMELRLALEPEAAALAAARGRGVRLVDEALSRLRDAVEAGAGSVEEDWAVHAAVAAASGNRLLAGLLGELGSASVLRQRASLAAGLGADPEHARDLVREHVLVRDAIARGDAESARAGMRVHLARSLAALPV